jgi:uncharacterized protein YegL
MLVDFKEILQEIKKSLIKFADRQENFSANHIFELKEPVDNCDEGVDRNIGLNKIVHFKERALFQLFKSLVSSAYSDEKIYEFEKYEFKLKVGSEKIFEEFKNKYVINSRELVQILANSNDSLNRLGTQMEKTKSVLAVQNILDFVTCMLDNLDTKRAEFNMVKFDFNSLDDENFYERCLSLAKGCETKCPCCGRPCDAEHHRFRISIGSQYNKHKCNSGHQFRCMNGYKMEDTNEPSFRICELMKSDDLILFAGTYLTWDAFKSKHSTWDFDISADADLTSVNRWRAKCSDIWSRIGAQLCDHFKMSHTPYSINTNPEKTVPPIHFILLLDSSSSMRGEKWQNLKSSVEKFISIRSNSPCDLITMLAFGSNVSTRVSNTSVKKNLIQKLDYEFVNLITGSGTNFQKAIESLNNSIDTFSSNRHKIAVIFMSDGEAWYPTDEMNKLFNKRDKIYKFWVIGFGSGRRFEVLNKITDKMKAEFKNPTDAIQLERAYCEIARNLD